MLAGDDQGMPFDPFRAVQGPDEIANASPPSPLRTPQPLVAARCVNGNLVRPDSAEEESPSTACRQSIVTAPGGVPLGRAPPGQQQLPGGLRGVPPPPPPPPPAPAPHAEAAPNATAYPLQWTPLHTRPKAPGGGGPPNDPGGSSSQSANGQQGQGGSAPSGGGGAAGNPGSGGGAPPPPTGQPGGKNPQGNAPPQQTGGAGFPGGHPQTPPGITQPNRHPDPWAPLDRSRKSLPKLMLPSNNKSCSILDMRQLLESWYDKSTFAIATWRGDAQRYWLTQVLDCARQRHDLWLQSTPAQRASLEPAYILGDRKHIPEAQNAVERVLRTELLDVIPKSIADACMRHGYCTAELIVWYVMKQLILPHDINEVTMQKEILTQPKVAPSTLDQGCAWLEEMQHRLNLCMKQVSKCIHVQSSPLSRKT